MRENSQTSKQFGSWGEETAADYLKKKGYSIVGLNYRVRVGEIDIIAKDRRFLVFVEVKTRKSATFAEAREYITDAKQRRLIYAAQLWLAQNPTNLQPRFDVIEIYAPGGLSGGYIKINHFENAFCEGR